MRPENPTPGNGENFKAKVQRAVDSLKPKGLQPATEGASLNINTGSATQKDSKLANTHQLRLHPAHAPAGADMGTAGSPDVAQQQKAKKVKEAGIGRRSHILRNTLIGAAAVGVVAVTGAGVYNATHSGPDNTPTTSGETGPIEPRLESQNWQFIPQNEVGNYTNPPKIEVGFTNSGFESKNSLDDKQYLSTVSPILQEKAKQAGYKIIYQGNPNDTTGRTLVTKGREYDVNNPAAVNYLQDEDFGFGETQGQIPHIKGIFKAWVPSPNDPKQQNEVYALLENPITGKSYLVSVSLRGFDPSYKTFPSYFLVDNLNKGYKDALAMNQKTGGSLGTPFLADEGDAGKLGKTLADFPTFNDLLEKQNVSLDAVAQPGDYVNIATNVTSISGSTSSKADAIPSVGLFTVRRFGGTKAWEQEVELSQPSSTEKK